jgi:small ligand-binding sensory domain FIST
VLWASAVSDATDLDAAVSDVAQRIMNSFRDEPIDLAVLFVSHHFARHYAEIPRRLSARIPYRTLVGCCAGGVIGGGAEVEQRPGIALTAAALPDVTVTPFALAAEALPDQDASPGAWRQVLGIPQRPVPHFILLADPFTFASESLLAGLDYAYPKSTKVGGLASGATRPGGNVLYLDRRIEAAGVVGVALAGDIEVDTIVAQGCRPIGEPMQVTRCDGHILYELDGESALKALQDLAARLSEDDRELMTHSLFLGVAMDELALEHRAGDFLVRNLMGIDVQHGAIAIGEHLRDGQSVQFHLRDAQTSADDLQLLLERFKAEAPRPRAEGALLFSCLGRGIHLYGEPDHDSGLFRRVVGDVPLGGFFCNGEIGPVGGATHLHGYTSSFGLFRAATTPAALE